MVDILRPLLPAALGAMVLAAAGTAVASTTARAEIDAARKAELANLLEQDCGSCHGLARKGGLGSPLLPETLESATDEALADVILNGIPDTPMPPWSALMDREEALWIVRQLRKGIAE